MGPYQRAMVGLTLMKEKDGRQKGTTDGVPCLSIRRPWSCGSQKLTGLIELSYGGIVPQVQYHGLLNGDSDSDSFLNDSILQ